MRIRRPRRCRSCAPRRRAAPDAWRSRRRPMPSSRTAAAMPAATGNAAGGGSRKSLTGRSSSMKLGSAQTDSVSGEAKLSCTRCTVRSVGRAIFCTGPGASSGRRLRASTSSQCPRSSSARLASMRVSSRSFGVQAEHADCVGCQLLAVQLDVAGMDDGDTLRRQRPIRLPQPELAAVQCQRPAADVAGRCCPAPRRARA